MQSQKGQTLVLITLLMVLALGIGISVSSGFFKSLRSNVESDLSSRAVAVAEAAVEGLLLLPQATLESYIALNNCGSVCTLNITGSDGVVASAQVTLSYMGNSSSAYPIDFKQNDTVEVNLQSYPNNTNVYVCWNNPASGPLPSFTALYFYGTSGSYNVDNFSYNSLSSSYSNGFSTASSNFGYTNCFTITGKTTPVSVRVRALYADATAYIVPANGSSIPTQGILMTSTGTVKDTVKIVQVVKGFSYTPTIFDYVLYQKTTDSPLSN